MSYLLSLFFVASFVFSSPDAAVGYHQGEIDRLRAQQENLKKQEQQNKALLEQKEQEADTLEHTISHLNQDITYTNSRIVNTQDQISTTNQIIIALNSDITTNEELLMKLTNKLNNAYISVYELSQISTIEIILQSSTLDEIVSQTQYIQAIQTDLQNDIEKANIIRADLDQKKTAADKDKQDLESLNIQLASSKNNLSYQKNQKDNLLDQTEGEQAKYEQLIADIRRKNIQVEAQIIAMITDLYNSGNYASGPGVGTRVSKGTPVGVQGSTGFSTGDHVHFEVREGNVPKNPRNYINNGVLSWPLRSFWVSQEFGENWWTGSGWAYGPAGHTGIDIVGPYNSIVYAPADGTVVINQCIRGYGKVWVEVTDNDLWVLVGHMKASC